MAGERKEMIINIAGTSGAGKSTVVRKLIEASTLVETITNDQQKEVGRVVNLDGRDVTIAGRYESWDTGGCDTVKDVEFWYNFVSVAGHIGWRVVFEGLFVMNHTRGLKLVRDMERVGQAVHIILLTTTLAQCQAAINERRARRGDPPFTGSWRNVEGNIVRANNFASKLKQLGAKVHRCTRDEAYPKLEEILRS
jgi:predicted ABC-type ATPase